MALPQKFLNFDNFALAFRRIIRGSNKDYKQFYRHLFPSYEIAIDEILRDLLEEIRVGSYHPSTPEFIYLPKASGTLRTLTILTLRDHIVYQAICNFIADQFYTDQKKLAFSKSFGCIYAGFKSDFFFRSWKVCYGSYNSNIRSAFNRGNKYIGSFDLVSFYDLIDHDVLARTIESRVKNREIIDLLVKCIKYWTFGPAGQHLSHGIPQGPEASAFLAECIMFKFDLMHFPEVNYFRYVDDIKLMAKDESKIKRALLKLDLASRELGLVPQAEKIKIEEALTLESICKSIPSYLQGIPYFSIISPGHNKSLVSLFYESILLEEKWQIVDISKFKFSIVRLRPDRNILHIAAELASSRPDCSWVFASYFKKFPKKVYATKELLSLLQRQPLYDLEAANYISALRVCQHDSLSSVCKNTVKSLFAKSEEKSILIPVETVLYRSRYRTPKYIHESILQLDNAIARGIVIDKFMNETDLSRKLEQYIFHLSQNGIHDKDEDYARYCAYNLIKLWTKYGKGKVGIAANANRSVKILEKALGLRKNSPPKESVLSIFFEKQGISSKLSWSKALGRDLRDAESRCLRLQQLLRGEPTSRILILDTFNEALLQRFSQHHPSLKASYRKASGKNKHPDFGNWINNPDPQKVIPKAINWFRNVHDARVKSDMAHAKHKKKGTSTKPVSYRKADAIFRFAKAGWGDMIKEWEKFV